MNPNLCFVLQGNPVLLLPWLGYVCICILVDFILSIVNAAYYFSILNTASGAGFLIGGFIGICKYK
jgi:hypothetical protein